MNGKDILLAMGEVAPRYYTEAQQRAQSTAAAPTEEWHTEECAFVEVKRRKTALMPILTGVGSVAVCLLLIVGLSGQIHNQGGSEESSLPEILQTDTTATNADCLHTVSTTTTIATYPTPPETGKQLTMDDVIRLSAKGEALSWENFAGYTCTDIGSGLYIFQYIIDDDYTLYIGGAPDSPPLYMNLSYRDEKYIDIRTEDVAAFVKESLHTPPEPKRFTLEDVIALSAKGQALSWKDFFDCEEIESDGEIEICQSVADDFTLKVGGKPDAPPAYADLIYKDGQCLDIRTGDVEAFITACRTPVQQLRQLTLEDVVNLAAAKGEALSWEDFAGYLCTDVGLYTYEYIIDADFSLLIGGVPESAPLCITLTYRHQRSVEIRTEDVAAFIEECTNPAPDQLPVTVTQSNGVSEYYGDSLGYCYDFMVLQQPPDTTAWEGTMFAGLDVPGTMQQDAFYEENTCIALCINTGCGGLEYGIQSAEITADCVLHLEFSEYSCGLHTTAFTNYYLLLTVPQEHLPVINSIAVEQIEQFSAIYGENEDTVYAAYLATLPEELYLTLPTE